MLVALAVYPPGERERERERERDDKHHIARTYFQVLSTLTYLAVVLCSHILYCTKAQLWSHVSVCPSPLVIQVTEILRRNCRQKKNKVL